MASGKTDEIPQRRVSPAIGYQTEKHRTCGAFFYNKKHFFWRSATITLSEKWKKGVLSQTGFACKIY